MNAFGIIGGLLIGLIHIFNVIYVGNRLYKWFSYIFPKLNVKIFSLLFGLIGILTLFSLLPLSLPIWTNYYLRMIGGYITGILLYVLLFLILADLIFLIIKKTTFISINNQKRVWFLSATLALCFGLMVSSYGIYNAKQVRITTYEVELLRSLKDEMTVVLISDLHLGEIHSERRLEQVVSYINKISPDIVTIAGDIFNDDFYALRNPDHVAELFMSIDSRFGVFACLGNHDTGSTVNSMIDFLKNSNVALLHDDYVIIDNRLILIGRLDSPLPWMAEGGFGGLKRRDIEYIIEDINNDLLYLGLGDLPIIVMDHNPTHINEYDNTIDMALFGHTHRGGMFPFNIVTNLIYTIHHGHLQLDAYSPHFIVTSGVHGWSMPLRVGSHNEIVKIVMR